MRDGAASIATREPRGWPGGSLFALPRHPRTMLAYDASLAWATLLLLAAGVVMVYSASIASAEASPHTGFRAWYFLLRHAIFVAAGLAAALVAFQMPMKAWQHAAPWLFVAAFVLLVLVLVPGIGRSVNGSRRWLSLVVINLQPSELMKLTVVLYAASYAVRKAAFLHAQQPLKHTLLRGFLPLFVVMVATGGLLLLSPTSVRSSSLSRSRSRSCSWAGSTGVSSWACCSCSRLVFPRFSSRRRIDCNGSSRFSIRGPILSARVISFRTR